MRTKATIIKEAQRLKEEGKYRYGQAVFNLVSGVDPEFAESLVGTNIDPFHNDKVSMAFLNKAVQMGIIGE